MVGEGRAKKQLLAEVCGRGKKKENLGDQAREKGRARYKWVGGERDAPLDQPRKKRQKLIGRAA